jgi:hypothetical protein
MEELGLTDSAGLDTALEGVVAADLTLVALRVDEDESSGWRPSAVQVQGMGDQPQIPLLLGGLTGEDQRDLVVYGLDRSVALAPVLGSADGSGDCLLESVGPVSDDMADAWHTASGISSDSSGPPAMVWEAWLSDGECDDCGVYDDLNARIPKALRASASSLAISRHRIRYDRTAGSQEPILQRNVDMPADGIRRIIEHRWELEAGYARCDGASVDHPGTCFGAAYWAERAQQPTSENEELPQKPRRCSSDSRSVVLLLPFLLAGIRRRQ